MQSKRSSGGLGVRVAMTVACLACWVAHAPAQTAYYLNDASTNGNFYTTGPGNDANSGTNAASPMRTLTNLLAIHTLGPGDIVYIDTGVYSNYTTTISVSGSVGAPIVFQGAPRDGATVFDRNNTGADVIRIAGAHVHLRNMTIRGGASGVRLMEGGDHAVIYRAIIRNNTGYGIQDYGAGLGACTIENTVIAQNGIGAESRRNLLIWRNCVFWNNETRQFNWWGGLQPDFRNCVFVGEVAFTRTGSPTIPSGDHNVFWVKRHHEDLAAYVSELNMPNSIHADPNFADPENYNFHPKSLVGRYDPFTDSVVTDAVHSVLIDFGNPASTAWTNEPFPNGDRLNAGVYGGTDIASMSRTNPWLVAITFNDGGGITGSVQQLRWNYGAFSPESKVTLEYSPDLGLSWSNIVAGVDVTNRVYAWDVGALPPMAAYWRVVKEADTNIWSRSERRFSVNGAKVPYYVNDGSTNGNVYTTVAGDDTHDGITPATPMRTLTNLLASYHFGGHDMVYVDTGVYSNYTVTVGMGAGGSPAGGRFTIRGSTNLAAGGSVINRNNTAQLAVDITAGRVNVEQFAVRNGLRLNVGANQVALRNLHISGMNGGAVGAVNLASSIGVTMEGCVVHVTGAGATGVRINNQAFTFDRGVVQGASNVFMLVGDASTNTLIRNSAMVGGTLFGDRIGKGDYNILWNTAVGGIYPTLNALQKDVNAWWNSAVLNPGFADAANSNFFPRSTVGRYDPDIDDFVADAEHSPMIDFGDPASTAWTNEPDPNGGRLNVGAYGGTPWASMSRTNEWLQVLTYTGGGVLNAEQADLVHWTGGNFPTGATVRIELSTDAGVSWETAQTGLLASAGSYAWGFTNVFSSTSSLWRVVYEENTNVASQTENTFTFRNGPFVYYVNNHSTEDNVYTTEPGNDANLGSSPAAPKASLASVFATYTLGAGDVVYVDTGTYTLTTDPVISSIHFGSTNDYVYIIGSTNYAAGGTVFHRGSSLPTTHGLHLNGAAYFEIRDIHFRNAGVGVFLNGSTGSRLRRVTASQNVVAGIRIENSPGATLERVVGRQNVGDGVRVGSGDIAILHGVLWRNQEAGLRVTGGAAHVTNSVVVASGHTAFGYHSATATNILGNYNNLHAESNAVVGFIAGLGRNQDTLSAWSAETGQELMSLSADPLFANPPADFHLKTQTIQGRYDPALGWVTDPVTSPLIDAGDPASDYAQEPEPHGGRINIGLYGNTPEASIGRTAPWLYAASLRQGGWVKGTTTLHWVAGNLGTGDLVRVEFSPDGGGSWTELADDIPATDETRIWTTTDTGMTVAGLWRVSLVAAPSVISQTTNFFVIRNDPVAWYVNNADTNNNVFTSNPGSPTNWVATSEQPLDSLASVFARYDVEPGDVIYVDTGPYPVQAPVVIERRDSGVLGNPVVIMGSTHCSVPGATLNFSGGIGLDISDVRSVVVSNIIVTGASTGARIQRSRHVELTGMRTYGSSTSGIHLFGSSNIVVRRSVMADGAGFGITGLSNQQVHVRQSVIWSNQAGAIMLTNAVGVTVYNSMLTVSGTGKRLYQLTGVSDLRSDFNNIHVENNADFALHNGVLRRFLTSWQTATTNDLLSLTHPPFFVDPANGDFHLRSEAGRFDPALCDFVIDGETSPMIDAADPSAPFGEETDPNGGRMNMGLYGNHAQASRTPATPRLIVVSLYSGGTIRGTNNLYWIATGAATGHTVRVEYSSDEGENWTILATNIAANAGQYLNWDTTVAGTIPSTFWRVVSENDESVIGSNAVPFMINNGAIAYYVNNASTNGNVYTTAPGNSLFDGLDPATPLPTLSEVMSRYPIQAGDRIYIDTGEYVFPGTVTFDTLVSGEGTNFVHIIGSTNYAAGGTVINGQKSGPVLRFLRMESYAVSHLRFTNTLRAVELVNATNSLFDHIEIDFPEDMSPVGNRHGFWIEDSKGISMSGCAIHGLTNAVRSRAVYALRSTNLLWNSGVIWSNHVGIELAGGSHMQVSNSVIAAFGTGRVGILVSWDSSFEGDYNNMYTRHDAYPVHGAVRQSLSPSIIAPIEYRSVEKWRSVTGKGAFTLSHDPRFFDAASGNFFLQSQTGRYDVATGAFVTDPDTSPLIDAGDPTADFSNEPEPNGGRINIGRYGNTVWASMTPTNPALTVLSFHDGGVARGTNVILRWLARGSVTNETVRIRFSADDGASWSDLAVGVPAGELQYAWDSTLSSSTLAARWRIESESPPVVTATNEVRFAVRNTNFVFYVNDDSTNHTIYTTAIGDSTNTGLATDSPLPGLADVFARYDVEPGDTIYVDTGTYHLGGVLRIRQEDAGSPTNHVAVIGSTHRAAGGTVFTGGGLRLDATRGLTIKHLTFDRAGESGGTSIHVLRATNTLMQAVDVIGGGNGFHIEDSTATRMIHCSARNTTTNGLFNDGSLGVVWDQGLLWSNRYAVRGFTGTVISNSVLGAFGPNAYIYFGGGALVANYNSIRVHQGAWVARESVTGQALPNLYQRLGNWVQSTGRDRHSLAHDPLFANPGTGDFHLKSQAEDGRFVVGVGWVQDDVTSPLIDAAGPSAPFAAEPEPNGGRANIGRYGNTIEASRTPTNAVLHAVSLYDGGTVRGTNLTLNWLAQGAATSHTTRVEFSTDNGVTWQVLASNITAGTTSLTWDISGIPSTVLARWKVVSEADETLVGQPSTVFAIRIGPVYFYVNDGSTNGNVYTTAAGSPGNTGTTPADPKNSIRDIFTIYDLEPGDVVYVDTGTYTLNQTIDITSLDAGSQASNLYVTVMGSTNRADGGTILEAAGRNPAIRLTDAEFIALRHLTIRDAIVAIVADNSRGYDFRHLQIEGGGTGVSLLVSPNGRFRHCLIRNVQGTALSLGSSGTSWDHGVLWSNATSGTASITMSGGLATFSNTVFSQFGENAIFSWNHNTDLQSDYNFFHLNEDAYVSRRTYPSTVAPLPMISQNLSRWARDYGRDLNSLAGDPLFADPMNGDFHPQSIAGRFDPLLGDFVMTDTNTSLLIDSGSPEADFSQESEPNGGRVNIGLYGNTAEASRSPDDARLAVVSLRDGGRVEGDSFPLHWRAYGEATNHTVRIDFSPDDGENWEEIITNVNARAESIFWDTSHTSSWLGVWRVMSETDTNMYDVVLERFAVRNEPLALYINDVSTNGAVYTTAPGSMDHCGTSPSTPRDSLRSVLDDYVLEPGDTIYMDTGSYILSDTVTWSRFDAWHAMTNLTPLVQGGASVTLQGSTNDVAGGTRITRVNAGTALDLVDAYGVRIRHIRFNNVPVGSGRAIRFTRSPYSRIEWVHSANASTGIDVSESADVRIHHTVLSGSSQYGLLSWRSPNTEFHHGIFWSNAVGARVQGQSAVGGSLTIENSVFGVLQSQWAGIEREDTAAIRGVLYSDYNIFHVVPGAFIGRQTGPYPGGEFPVVRLSRWTERTGQDANSLGTDPLFANAVGGDFHPRSPYGRFQTGVGYVTNTLESFSPLIDGGRPSAPFDNEPDPNGDRVNIGLYGNTAEASMSPTNGVLRLLTFNDGGSGFSNIWLRWTASGPVAEHLVTIDFSGDGGMHWTNLAINVPASAEAYLWDSTPHGRVAAGIWRITSQSDPGMSVTNNYYFRLRQDGSVPYYVNHPASPGDVYTMAPGNNNNDGFLPITPKASLKGLLDDPNVELEPGDVVYIDTGVYQNNVNTRITILEAGTSNNPVIFRGSTNWVAGGTVLDRMTGLGAALELYRTEGIRIEHIKVQNAEIGISVLDSRFVDLFNIESLNNQASGVGVSGSSDVRLDHSALWGNIERGLSLATSAGGGASVGANHLVIWNSPVAVSVPPGTSIGISNSVLQALSPVGRIYAMGVGVTNIHADYNNYIRAGGAVVAERQVVFGGNEFYPRMLDWQRFLGQDLNSLSHAPEFAAPGSGDFHPRSVEGRWLSTNWVTDEVHSPLIDTGSPLSSYEKEEYPHGYRVNIGRYGNTPEASLSQTNPWLLAVSVNDGGVVYGTQRLYWVVGGMEPTDTVRVEFTPDGIDYSALVTNVPVSQTEYIWNASALPVTQNGKWRVVSENHAGVMDGVDQAFVVKNDTIVVYVNDGSTNGAVYTTAPGDPGNDGLSPEEPLDNPATAIAMYPFGPGDILYIDTGEYVIPQSDGMRLGLIGDTLKSGMPGLPVTILGSTNFAAGGSRLIGTGANNALLTLDAARNINVYNLSFSNAERGVRVANSEEIELNYLSSHGNVTGFELQNARDVLVSRAAAYQNDGWGFRVSGIDSLVDLLFSVASSNRLGSVSVGINSTVKIEHSILDAAPGGSLAYSVHGQANISGDFNMIWSGTNAVFARDISTGVGFGSLRSWQRVRNMDYFSVRDNPLFADPSGGDFHLRSQEGRFNPETEDFEADPVTSWAIDAGDFHAPFGNEPMPNGGRVNIGRYGNTTQASMTVTNPVDAAIKVVSLRDGGSVGFEHTLYWLYRGLDADERVTLEYSPNNGVIWLPIATNVPVSDLSYFWDFSEENSTPLGLWRIEVESDPGISDQTPVNFTVRNGPISYYVNVTNTAGDIYTQAPGHSTNDGITVYTPVDSISAIVDRYELLEGDTIYVDTGIYEVFADIRILANVMGVATNRVIIQGSTNRLAGGSVLHRVHTNGMADTAVFDIFGTRYLEIRDFTIQNADVGIRLANPRARESGHLLKNLLIRDGGSDGIEIDGSSIGNRLERVVITRHQGSGMRIGSATTADSLVIWSNRVHAVHVNGALSISNSVLHAMNDATNVIFNVGTGQSVMSDYNALFADRGASYARKGGFLYRGLPQWSEATGQDWRSLAVDPLFADPENDDYHLLSEVGRYSLEDGWLYDIDVETSWLIDTGSPYSPWDHEPWPNGGRRNIGLYGNTPEASLSRTNEWLFALTAVSGGRMGGIFPLYWTYGNLDVTNRVRLDYSLDNGDNWFLMAENLPINQDGYFWDSLAIPDPVSPIAKWRVVLEANTNIWHTADTFFGLNGPFTFYVNDASTNNNVYTTAPGDDGNLGFWHHAPKATLKNVIDSWDIEPEDLILIDTGTYLFDTNTKVSITIDNQGAAGFPVTIRGSTNEPGTVLDAAPSLAGPMIDITAAHMVLEGMKIKAGTVRASGTNVVFRDMRFTNSILQIFGTLGTAENLTMDGGSLQVSGDDALISRVALRDGPLTMSGARAMLENSIVTRNAGTLVTVSGTNTTIRNNTIVGGVVAVRQTGGGSSLNLYNNILIANRNHGAHAQVIQREAGTLQSDYNLLLGRNGAWIGNAGNGMWETLIYWQQQSGHDLNSLSAEPLFANEADRDYHLKSSAGRYEAGAWVTDAVDSPAIDAGDPSGDFVNEPTPNGGRINLGAYGNTGQASKSRAAPWLQAVSFNDGGAVRGSNVVLRWLAGGAGMHTNTVTLQYRPDPGGGWINIVAGLSAEAGTYTWDTTLYDSSLFARWRVVLDSDPGVFDETDSLFSVRNDPQDFFVNNGVPDIYTTESGLHGNDGLTPATPKLTLTNLLATYDTVGGDVIYVDTGIYNIGTIDIIWSRGGDAVHGPLTIQGSTNLSAGGTVLHREGAGDGINVLASHIRLRDLGVRSANRGIRVNTNRHVIVERIFSYSNTIGVLVEDSHNVELRNLRIWKNTEGGIDLSNVRTAVVENVTFAGHTNYGLRARNNIINHTLQNNIFVVMETNATALSGAPIVSPAKEVFLDYNIYHLGADSFIHGSKRDLRLWQLDHEHDFRSAITDPLLHDVASGNFHLKSEFGRYDPETNDFVYTDTETSWAVGRGNPDSPFDRQPEPTAGRINLGAFGNTEFASMGSTGVFTQIRTLNDGITISNVAQQVQPLVWAVNNVPTNLMVDVQYSPDGGTTWITLETVKAYREYIVWTITPEYNTYKMQWRIYGEHESVPYSATNAQPAEILFGAIDRITHQFWRSGRQTIRWRGAWDETYRVEYTEDGYDWSVAPSGPGPDQENPFTTTLGGDQTYEDIGSPGIRFRAYRVIRETEE